jgi:hypothetical protein
MDFGRLGGASATVMQAATTSCSGAQAKTRGRELAGLIAAVFARWLQGIPHNDDEDTRAGPGSHPKRKCPGKSVSAFRMALTVFSRQERGSFCSVLHDRWQDQLHVHLAKQQYPGQRPLLIAS